MLPYGFVVRRPILRWRQLVQPLEVYGRPLAIRAYQALHLATMASTVIVTLVENCTCEVAHVLDCLVPDPRCRGGRLCYGLFVPWLPRFAAMPGNQATNRP